MNAVANHHVVELNGANFAQEVLAAGNLVLVQFWAGWSDPCRAMAPMVESVAEAQAVPIKVARVNVEENEALTEEYGVRCVPTLLIFNLGSLADQIVGRASEWEVREKLARFK